MKERKHIDRLYQEKFRDFEVAPNDHMWDKISARLQPAKKKRILPLWSRIAGVAAMIAVIFTSGSLLWNNNTPSVVDIEENKLFDEPKGVSPIPSAIAEQETNSISSSKDFSENEKASIFNGSKKIVSSEELPLKNPKKEAFSINSIKQEKSALFDINNRNLFTLQNPNKHLLLITSVITQEKDNSLEKEENPLFKIEAEKEESKTVSVDGNVSKVKISTFAAPIYYNGFGKGNIIDPMFVDNEQGGEITMSYGVNIAYAVTDRIKIRSGVSKVAMSYNTMGINYGHSAQSATLRHLDYNNDSQSIYIQDATKPFSTNSLLPGTENQAANSGYLNQRLGFIELPLEVEFAVINNRLGVNIIGGASTLILNENTISLNSGDFSTHLGESNNLNPVSFSTNIGLGVDYKLTKKFQINIEPMFKYQINTFSSGSFKPYYLGVYSGVSYKF